MAKRKSTLLSHWWGLGIESLANVCRTLEAGIACRLVAEDDRMTAKKDFLQEVMLYAYERRKFQTETINAMPLYPTENILWDENQIPNVHYTGKSWALYL